MYPYNIMLSTSAYLSLKPCFYHHVKTFLQKKEASSSTSYSSYLSTSSSSSSSSSWSGWVYTNTWVPPEAQQALLLAHSQASAMGSSSFSQVAFIIIAIIVFIIFLIVIFMQRLLTGWMLPLNYQLMQLVKKIFAPNEVPPHYQSYTHQNYQHHFINFKMIINVIATIKIYTCAVIGINTPGITLTLALTSAPTSRWTIGL